MRIRTGQLRQQHHIPVGRRTEISNKFNFFPSGHSILHFSTPLGPGVDLSDDVDPFAKRRKRSGRRKSLIDAIGNVGRPLDRHHQSAAIGRHWRPGRVLQSKGFARLLRHTHVIVNFFRFRIPHSGFRFFFKLIFFGF